MNYADPSGHFPWLVLTAIAIALFTPVGGITTQTKCVKKEITKTKANISHEKEIEKQIIDEFGLLNGQYTLFMDFLTSNSANLKFIVYGYIYKNENEGVCFIGLVENESGSFEKLNTLVPLNAYEYKTEFMEFKATNNW